MKKFGKFLLVTGVLATAATGVYLYLKDRGIISDDTCGCGCGCDDDDCDCGDDCDCDEDRSYVSLDKGEATDEFEPISETVKEVNEEDADTVEEFFDDAKDSEEKAE